MSTGKQAAKNGENSTECVNPTPHHPHHLETSEQYGDQEKERERERKVELHITTILSPLQLRIERIVL